MKSFIRSTLIAAALLSAGSANADSFPQCAYDDAKCVGEVLLQAIRWNGGGGGTPARSTFCVCEMQSDTCHNGQSWVRRYDLKLKRISDGSVISNLEYFVCENNVTPQTGCQNALQTNPVCR